MRAFPRVPGRPHADHRAQSHQLRPLEVGELHALDTCEPERLGVERLLEERARKARISEALAAPGTTEDLPKHRNRVSSSEYS